jgi:hypothetical protein
VWIFCNAHGASRPAYVFRGLVPFSIEGFEHVLTTNFSYGQPWYVPGHGFLFLHTRYGNGRGLFWMTSRDGRQWSEPEPLAHVELGHYQVSWRIGTRVGTAFNYHPRPSGLNARTNLYYLETADGGASWRTAAGAPVALPLEAPYNPALVRVYRGDHRLVYLKDLEFDSEERPVILYLTSRGYVPGSQNDPRVWHTARWTGTEWDIRELTQSDHNYDHGSLYIESDGAWRVIAPTDAGAQPYGTGGGVVMWLSHDQGRNWSRVQTLTHDSHYNHTYVRKPWNAADDFYALWADGDTLHASDCHLYFTNRLGTGVWQLPPHMDSAWARPERIQ